jgi:nitrogen fixation NifU-like protein
MSARDLYQELILDHAKNPHNHGALPDANAEAGRENLSCGDSVHLYLRIEQDQVVDARFEGEGCALSTASASMMTDAIKGKTLAQVQAVMQEIRAYISGQGELETEALEEFEAFAGVRHLPSRTKCVALPWAALDEALSKL